MSVTQVLAIVGLAVILLAIAFVGLGVWADARYSRSDRRKAKRWRGY